MQMIKIKTRAQAQAKHNNSNINLAFQILIYVEQQAVCENKDRITQSVQWERQAWSQTGWEHWNIKHVFTINRSQIVPLKSS